MKDIWRHLARTDVFCKIWGVIANLPAGRQVMQIGLGNNTNNTMKVKYFDRLSI